jgi:hypothetical protein
MDNIIECPHCKAFIIIKELNCKIFRHGIYKNNYEQVNPHAPKDVCDELVNNELVYGCCKPFQIIEENGKYNAVICDYI